MNMTWSCSRCDGVRRHRSRVRWYEAWFKAISTSRPFCCTTCGRRAWSAAPKDPLPVIRFTAPVDEVDDVSLAALDAILTDLPPAGSAAAVDELVFDDDEIPARPRRPRSAPRKRRRTRGADISVH